jgi:phage-related protein
MANMSLGDAVLTTSVDLTGLDKGLGEAEGMASTKGAAAGNALGMSMAAGVAAAGAAVVAAIGATIVAATGFAMEQDQSIRNLQATLGLTADEAAELGSVAEEVFLNNFGGSITEASEAVGEVRRQLGDLSDGELQSVTEGAFSIADAFGTEMPETINTVKTLMSQFGLSSQDALDFVTTGFQQGLNSSDDFIDTIGEYSNLFAESGFTASEFFSVMETGLQGGMLGTDKAADAFKEFGLRIMAVGDELVGPEGALRGLMPDGEIARIWDGLKDGSLSVADAYNSIMPILAGMDNAVHQNSLGVALFGTQWEDMGASAMLAINTTTTTMGEMGGATTGLGVQYTSLGAVWETVNRQLLVTIAPIGEAVLALANFALPYLLSGFETMRAGIEVAINAVSAVVHQVIAAVSGVLSGTGTTSVNSWGAVYAAVQGVIGSYIAAIQSIITTVIGAVAAFWQQNGDQIMAWTQATWQTIGSIITLAMQLIQAIVVPIWQAVAAFIAANQDTIVAVLTTAWNNISTIISTVLATIEGIIKIVLAAISGDWGTVWETLKTTTTTIIEGIKTIVESTITGMRDVALGILDSLVSGFGERFDSILSAVTNLGERAYDAGASFINSIRDGIMNTISGLIADARRALQELADLLPGSEPKDPTSPLRGLGARGRAIVENMLPGMSAGFGEMDAAMRDGLSGAADISASRTEFNLTAQYGYQPERRLADDVRMLQLLGDT